MLVFGLSLWLWMGSVCLAQVGSVGAGDDFDVVVIPVVPPVKLSGKDWHGPTLAEKGLRLEEVDDYPVGELIVESTDVIQFRLEAGEAVRLWSDPIPVEGGAVWFSSLASAEGDALGQAGVAFLDAENFDQIAVSLSYVQDIPQNRSPFSFEYPTQARQVYLLIQFVGPEEGESVVTLERVRVAAGVQEIQFALGKSRFGKAIHFGEQEAIIRNDRVSTPGGYYRLEEEENRQVYPHQFNPSMLLGCEGAGDVVQLNIVFPALAVEAHTDGMPERLYAEAYVKPVSGEGIFSLALVSGVSFSLGYTDVSLPTLAKEAWTRVEIPVWFTGNAGESPVVIVQLRGGAGEILVDDVAIVGRQDSVFYWNAEKWMPEMVGTLHRK
jgi:hypothetical protein